MLCQFFLYSKVNQLYVYIYPLFFRFSSHLHHHRTCVIQQVLISYLFYAQYQQCVYVNPSLPIHPTLPPWYLFVFYVCLYICFASKIVCVIFLDSTLHYTFFHSTPNHLTHTGICGCTCLLFPTPQPDNKYQGGRDLHQSYSLLPQTVPGTWEHTVNIC